MSSGRSTIAADLKHLGARIGATIPANQWRAFIGDPTYADTILDTGSFTAQIASIKPAKA